MGYGNDERRQFMQAVRLEQTVAEDGELTIKGLPYKRGDVVEIIVLPQAEKSKTRHPHLTVGELRRSGLIGLWEDRSDIEDSALYARRLREQAQRRDFHYDSAG
jgi:hypothetical protein